MRCVMASDSGGRALAAASRNAGPALSGKPVSLERVESFLSIGADGSVTCYSGKVDLGVVDELTVPFEKVQLVMGDTLLTPDQGPTNGSFAIQVGGIQIRQAAATVRAALVYEAAGIWQLDASELMTEDGAVRTRSGARQISFAELVRGKSLALPVDAKAPLLDPSPYRVVGHSVPRVDIPGKVTGEFMFMHDFHVPGMVHARVVRPPAIGARLLSVDEKSVAGIPDLIRVVRQGNNFLAVVAASEWGAIKAARELKATWPEWAGLPDGGEALRARARDQDRQGRRHERYRRCRKPRCPVRLGGFLQVTISRFTRTAR